MPANLPPVYKEAEQRFREAKGRDAKLAALREMMTLLPKHKGTEKLQGELRRRMSKLETEGERRKGGAKRFDPGHVPREGAGQWALIGAPNAGKSALLRSLTHAHPEVAPYPFTTRVPLPGMMPFEEVHVQLVDTPAVTSEHQEPYMPNLVHVADGVLVVIDVADDDLGEHWQTLANLIERARVWPAARQLPDELPPYVEVRPLLVLANKSDLDDDDGTFLTLAKESIPEDLPLIPVSAEHGAGLEALRERLFRDLHRIRVYTKEPGKEPDLEAPFVLAEGATIRDLARTVHKDVEERLKYARLWGSGRFDGQQVERHHVLLDRDIVELHA